MSKPGDSTRFSSWLGHLYRKYISKEPQNRKQLIQWLRNAERRHLLDAEDLARMEGVMHVSEMKVRDVMVPRVRMVMVRRDQKPEEFLPAVIESAHSRFPVLDSHRSEVIGILLAKDLLPHCFQKETHNFDSRQILRPVVFVPESKRLDTLLEEFQKKRNHIAIAVDEYGNYSGLVTIEDVLEQIVGEIVDEHDYEEEESFIARRSSHEFTVKALTPIESFNEFFCSEFGGHEFDTIGGLVTQAFGHLPQVGEQQEVGSFYFKVLRADNRRVHLFQVKVLGDPPKE